MEMLSSWWGGKPTTKTTDGEVEQSSEPLGGKVEEVSSVAEKSEPQPDSPTDPAPADTASEAGGSASESATAAKSETISENKASDEQADGAPHEGQRESADVSEESENNKGTFDLAGMTNMTKEEASEAAEAALHSAYNFGSFLFKKVSDTATKTASMIQKTVEEKTIVGEFQKEQAKFVTEKHSKRQEAAVPPWVGYNEEEQMKEQIMALSQDKRNFMRNPPAGVQFHFDYNSIHPVAMATLQEDPNLKKMRFELVPKMIKEENFWRNYFYRVSLIKQSSQLTSLSKSGEERKGSGSASHSSDEGSSLKGDKTPPINVKGAPSVPSEPGQLEMEPPDSPPGAEFISDDFTSELDEADLKKGMAELGMDKKGEDGAEEVPEWEKELQQELQDYEVVADEPNEEWEREINQMLEDEVNNE